jgi:hypothetical protein
MHLLCTIYMFFLLQMSILPSHVNPFPEYPILHLHFGYFNFKASYGQHSCIILNFYLQYMGPSTRYNRLEN